MSTAVVAILASSAVALASIGANVWQQRRAFSHERQMVDLGDTRALFDDAAKSLSDASNALLELWRALVSAEQRVEAGDARRLSEAFVAEKSPELTTAMQVYERLTVVRGRLYVRFDQTRPVLTWFSHAYDATETATTRVLRMAEPGAPDPVEAIQEAHDRLLDATGRFMEAAVATVGPRLPSGFLD
jgi:hypothetical protein